MPRFLKLLASASDASASSSGRMRGSASISVTLVPKALKMSANSQPTAPAPMTAMVFGHLLEEQRLVRADDRRLVDLEPDLRNALHPRAGGDDDGLPRLVLVASPTFTVRFLPRMPVPLMTVILCFFIRNSTPLEFCSETLRERRMATP